VTTGNAHSSISFRGGTPIICAALVFRFRPDRPRSPFGSSTLACLSSSWPLAFAFSSPGKNLLRVYLRSVRVLCATAMYCPFQATHAFLRIGPHRCPKED